jgi:nitric oxide dioxygenase
VRATWGTLAEHSDEVAFSFYSRFFEANPELRSMFKEDMAEQHRRFVVAITMALDGLDDLEKLKPTIKELGRRHATYGATEPHYEAVGTVLLLSLGEALRDAFTEEVRCAWTDFYNYLAKTMQGHHSES